MAKKVVATLKKGERKHYARVIRAIKNEETGSYTFREDMVPDEMVKETLAKKD